MFDFSYVNENRSGVSISLLLLFYLEVYLSFKYLKKKILNRSPVCTELGKGIPCFM